MTAIERIVIAGASLAGVNAAKALRRDGFEGTVTVIGAEPHRPYDRPPLSKQVIVEDWDIDRIALAGLDEIDLTWELGRTASTLDLRTRTVGLDDGRTLAYDGLVIATGANPRSLPVEGTTDRVLTLRTLDDARRVRSALDAGAGHVVVVGAGFIGAEVAASCRERGVDVTIVEPLDQPLQRVLGPAIGAVVADIHRSNGVDVRMATSVDRLMSHGDQVDVRLSDGASIRADLVVVGIGVIPNTRWLEGSGLTLDDGVVCDETTLAASGVVAAGDVARWPSRRYEQVLRVEHWDHAVGMGAHAARRLLADDDQAEAFDPVPYFWSDQYDRKLQLVGRSSPGDEHALVAGSYEDRRFCVLYGRQGRVTAALGMNMPAKVMRYSRALTEGLAWDDALADAQS